MDREARAGDCSVLAGGGAMLSRQPGLCCAAEPFYNDFFCVLRLLQVWTRRWGQARDARYRAHRHLQTWKQIMEKNTYFLDKYTLIISVQ